MRPPPSAVLLALIGIALAPSLAAAPRRQRSAPSREPSPTAPRSVSRGSATKGCGSSCTTPARSRSSARSPGRSTAGDPPRAPASGRAASSWRSAPPTAWSPPAAPADATAGTSTGSTGAASRDPPATTTRRAPRRATSERSIVLVSGAGDLGGDRLGADGDLAQVAGRQRSRSRRRRGSGRRRPRASRAESRCRRGRRGRRRTLPAPPGSRWPARRRRARRRCRRRTAAPVSVRRATPGLTAISPRLIAAMVPTSMSGMRCLSLIAEIGPIAGRGNPSRARFPNASRDASRPIPSASLSGALRMRMLVSWIGMPRRSRGTTFTGARTARVGLAPRSARSSAISAPVLPAPTTSTRCPANASPLR